MDMSTIQVKDQASQNALVQQPSEAQALTLATSRVARGQLAVMVSQCFDALNIYGKEPEQVENIVAIFNLVLAEYSIKQIEDAFKTYLSRNSNMPTPADIAMLIRRGGKPPLQATVYTALCQKRERTSWKHGHHSWQQGNGLTTEEEEYIRDYEADAMSGHVSWVQEAAKVHPRSKEASDDE